MTQDQRETSDPGGESWSWRGWKDNGVAPGDTGLHVGCVGCSRRQPDPEDFVDGVKENERFYPKCYDQKSAACLGASRKRFSWDWALA